MLIFESLSSSRMKIVTVLPEESDVTFCVHPEPGALNEYPYMPFSIFSPNLGDNGAEMDGFARSKEAAATARDKRIAARRDILVVGGVDFEVAHAEIGDGNESEEERLLTRSESCFWKGSGETDTNACMLKKIVDDCIDSDGWVKDQHVGRDAMQFAFSIYNMFIIKGQLELKPSELK